MTAISRPATELAEPRTYSAADVARLFGVSRSTVSQEVIDEGAFLGVRPIRIGRRLLFSRRAIDSLLADYERVAPQSRPDGGR